MVCLEELDTKILCVPIIAKHMMPPTDAKNKIKELQYQVAVYEDQVAYKTLFFLLFPSLQTFAFTITHCRETAEEIASDLCIDIWVKRIKLQEIENLKLYLFICARNAAFKNVRQHRKQVNISLDELQVEFNADYANPEEEINIKELRHKILSAIKSLPPSCQLIYKLAKEEGFRYKDIASLLDVSVKTIDAQLAIALKKIAVALDVPVTKKRF